MTREKISEFNKLKLKRMGDWGEEILLLFLQTILLKIIVVMVLWLQYHQFFKDESAYVVYGKMILIDMMTVM